MHKFSPTSSSDRIDVTGVSSSLSSTRPRDRTLE